jgi:hypothetical protein
MDLILQMNLHQEASRFVLVLSVCRVYVAMQFAFHLPQQVFFFVLHVVRPIFSASANPPLIVIDKALLTLFPLKKDVKKRFVTDEHHFWVLHVSKKHPVSLGL